MVPKNFKLTDEFASVLALKMAELKLQNPAATEGKLLEILITQSHNSSELQAANNEIEAIGYSLESANTELSACKQLLSQAQSENAELKAKTISLQSQVESAQSEAISLQSEAKSTVFTALSDAFNTEINEINDAISLINSMNQKIHSSRPIDPNEIILTMPQYAVKLLQETAKRLSERFDRRITPEMILSDIFIRYTVEQFSEWFFPFVIPPAEMEQICGISHNNLKKALKQ